jgi:UDP-glucuronate 4-epimerase
MRIVVTGAAGFIGSHACERLITRGHIVTGIDSFDGYLYSAEVKRANARELARLPADRFRLVEADICDRAAIAEAIGPDTDVVCHLAALAGERPSLVDPLRYLRTNIEGTGVIAERMRELGLQRLVFASSSSVYGAKRGADPRAVAAFREDDPCLTPASPYAASKRMNEIQLSAYRDLFGIGVFALRFFTVYGPRQRPDMAINKFVTAIAAGQPITLTSSRSEIVPVPPRLMSSYAPGGIRSTALTRPDTMSSMYV